MTTVDFPFLEKIVENMRRLGIRKFAVDGVEVELDPNPAPKDREMRSAAFDRPMSVGR